MQVKKVIPSGYCKGVISAIAAAKKARNDYPHEKIYVLGMIVHNTYVTKALEKYGIITIDDKNKTKEAALEEINEGVIIFTAHGIAANLKKRALEKGLIVIDVSCTDVIKTQELILKRLFEGYEVWYIGKAKHPEAEAVLAISPDIKLLTDIHNLPPKPLKKLFVTNQTTMSVYDIADFQKGIKELVPDALIESEICNATAMRQKAIMDLKDCDLLYIVGDPVSNNTRQLRNIALKSGIKKAVLIETAKDLNSEDLKDVENVYVTAGASTPTYLTDQVIEALKYYDEKGFLPTLDIDINAIL